MRRTELALAALLAACAPAARAADYCHLEELGSNRLGPARAAVASGDKAYLVAGYSLEVIDLSGPSEPTVLARLDLDFGVRKLALAGSVLAAVGGPAGLVLFDVADPTNPIEISRRSANGDAIDIALLPGLALVAEHGQAAQNPRGLLVFDVSNPAAPELVGTYWVGSEGAEAVAAFGNYGFLSGYGLHILDLSDPTSPVQVGSERAGWELAVSPSGRRLYTFDWLAPPQDGYALRVLDVSDPTAPFLVASFVAYPDPLEGLAVGGGYVFTVDPYRGLLIYDEPLVGPPTLVATLGDMRHAADLAVEAGLLFASEHREGLGIIDVSLPATPTEVGRFATPGETYGIQALGSRAYLRTATALRILDLSDAARPVELGAFATDDSTDTAYGWRPEEFVIAGETAYVPDSTGLRILDLADPTQPGEIGTWLSDRPARTVAKVGDIVYLGTVSSPSNPAVSLHVLDVSVPTMPIEIAAIENDGWWPSSMVASPPLLVATLPWDCRVFDITDPSLPIQVGSCNVDPQHLDLALPDELLFVAGADALSIVDLSDPSAPALLGSLPNDWPPLTGVTLAGHRAVVAHEEVGILVVETSDPTAPVEVGTLPAVGLAHRVAFDSGRILVADGAAGITIYEDCLIFEDGFESGDTSRWTCSLPVGGAAAIGGLHGALPELRDRVRRPLPA